MQVCRINSEKPLLLALPGFIYFLPRFRKGKPYFTTGQWIVVLVTGFFSIGLKAQPVPDSNSVKVESQRLGINTFSVGSVADWRYTKTGHQRLEAGVGQYLVYNQALQSNRFITNNYQAGFFHQLWLNRRWQWQNKARQISYVANKTRLGQYQSSLQFTAWETPNQGLYFLAGLGVVNDKRVQYNNVGPSLNLEGTWYGRGADSSLSYRVTGLAYKAFIQPRRNEVYSGNVVLNKDFPDGGLLSGEAGYLRRKVEDFLGTDIQSIISDTIYARIRFQYGLSKNITFSSDNQVLTPNRSFFYRNIESQAETRNVRYFQTEYQSTNTLLYLGKSLKVNFIFESRQRNRTYDIINRLNAKSPGYFQELLQYNQDLEQERIKDIREQFTTFTSDVRWRLGRNHVVKFNYVAQLLRVDTRSLLNNQDRDEILYANELAYEWRLRPGFLVINKFSGSLRHFVFIEASQSSENFIDRIIRWEPGFKWLYKNLTWNSQMGIWATYQVRDFEQVQDKNRSNRVLIFNNQLTYRISQKLKLFTDALRRENRLSQLNWSHFSESPIDTVTLYDVSLRTQYQLVADNKSEWSVQVGYRAFWQIRKSKASLIDPQVGSRLIYLRNYIVQQGPQLKFMWQKSQRWEFVADFWLQWSSQYFRYRRGTDIYIGTSYSPEQLAVVDRRFLPYFTVKGIYFLQ